MVEKSTPPATPLPRSLKTSIVPNGNGSRQETIRLAIRLGSVVLLTGSVLIYACLRSKDLSVAEILAIIAGGAALAGLATAAHKSGGGGSTGTTILGGALLMIATVVATGCAVTQAQVAVQTSLTGLAEGVHAGDEALAIAVPRLSSEAISDARTRCAVTACADPLALYAEEMADVDQAVDGLEVAAEALRLAQVAQDAWVASDELPDAGPLCAALGDAVRPLAGLLDEAGVEVPPGIAGAGGVVEIMCGVMERWVRR